MYPIILASSSPRRQEIMKLLNIPFVVHPANISEDYPAGTPPEQVPELVAAKKVKAVLKSMPTDQEIQWILGADTVVIFKGRVYGKPRSQEEAEEFLRTLQGHTHTVATGLALYNGALHAMDSRTSINRVTFAKMDQKEIDWYIGTGEWHGVAGAYRIQGLSACFITKIEGSESSIMGLPIFELYDMLKKQGSPLAD